MDQKLKRNRGNNFSKEEELLLLSEIEKYKNIIECKMTDKVNLSEKNDAWRKILVGFNAKNGSHRNLDQLKIKYDNLKCKARKIVASNKQYVRGTGGGSAGDAKLDPVIECVIRIINKTTVVGLESSYDCDALSLDAGINDEVVPKVIPISAEIMMETNKNLNHDEQASTSNSTSNNWDQWDIIFDDKQTDRGSHQMELHPQETVVTDAVGKKKTTEQLEGNEKRKQTSWSKYTPRKLKAPMSRRLREVVNTPIKETYYKKKIDLMDEESKKRKLEQEDIIAKRLRDVEEHEKRMHLMNLEIKLKEKILNEK